MALYITDNNGVLHKIADVSSNIEVDTELSAESENPVQNKVVENALRGKVSIENVSNPNLLINGDFRVNQRGQTSYTGGNTYCVDRWYLQENTLTFNVETKTLTNNGTTTAYMYQKSEDLSNMLGKDITISAKIDGVVYSYQGALPTTFPTANATVGISVLFPKGNVYIYYYSGSNVFGYVIGLNAGQSIKLDYCKIEQGTVATPNSPRPYAEELALCQRYYQITSIISSLWQADSTTSLTGIIQFKGNMRTIPTTKQTHLMTVIGINENTSFKQTSLSLGSGMIALAEAIKIVVGGFTGLTKGNIYQPYLDVSMARFVLDAEIY